MFKFLVISMLVCLEIYEISGRGNPMESKEKTNTSKANVEESSTSGYNKPIRFDKTRATNLTIIYDVHLQRVEWSVARQMCQDNGGDLLVIRSNNEENFILKNMAQYSIKYLWLGVRTYGDNWMTIYDEFLNKTGWTDRTARATYEHCGLLDGSGYGLFSDECEKSKHQFICETPNFQ